MDRGYFFGFLLLILLWGGGVFYTFVTGLRQAKQPKIESREKLSEIRMKLRQQVEQNKRQVRDSIEQTKRDVEYFRDSTDTGRLSDARRDMEKAKEDNRRQIEDMKRMRMMQQF